jgi:2-polyprenyl-3-methyl-5-hydroxy-6-metoxy-1,4-benzoquinol methylase
MSAGMERLARNVTFDQRGFWRSPECPDVSYPVEGNDLCFSLEEDSFWFRHRNNAVVRLVSLFPPNGPILDIGGGNGYVARGLENAGFETVMVEPGERGAENAVRRGLNRVVCSTFNGAGFVEGAFGGAGLFDVLEHVENDVAFLQSIRRVLAPGGRLYITVPAHSALWSNDDRLAGHYRRYSPRSLEDVCRRAGFEPDFSTCIFTLLPVPVFLFRCIPSWLGFRREIKASVARAEHAAPAGIDALLNTWFSRELRRISELRPSSIGGSCLLAATAVQ